MSDIEAIRNSLQIVLAKAVRKLLPESRLGEGAATENGFYHDFYLGEKIPKDLVEEVEKAMKTIIKSDEEIERKEMTIEDAVRIFSENGESLKVELLKKMKADGNTEVSLCYLGDFVEICEGSLLTRTGAIPLDGISVEHLSSAYFMGDETREAMTRITGWAFQSGQELAEFMKNRGEILKRDHTKLGRELELFITSEEVGKGLPMFLPKGATMRRILEQFIVNEEIKRGYKHVYTPILGKKELYITSGHWEHYKESMYPPIVFNEKEYVLRPMTCPHHFVLYNSQFHSYRDLPVRYAEISPQYRREQSGELTGLIRLMGFHLADAHIMCRPDQVRDEFEKVIDLINYVIKCLGLTGVCWFRASLRDEKSEKYVQNEEAWKESEKILLELLEEQDTEFVIERGAAAFYGPKLDVQMRNVWGKEDTLFTNQIDMVMAERFDMQYVDEDNTIRRPIIIHRSSIGCLERTIAFLIEHYSGAFPVWIAPVQVRLLPISENQHPYSRKIHSRMEEKGIRVELDDRNVTLSKKIREGRLQRIPYLAIIGEKEKENLTITIRNRDSGNQAEIPYEEFIELLLKEDKEKEIRTHIGGDE
jgi:threonyl-tRNA synthetase